MEIRVTSVILTQSSATVRIKISDIAGHEEIKELYLLRDLVSDLPCEGDILDIASCNALIDASHDTEAVKIGLNILSFGANSEAMLITKLRRRKISPQSAARAAEYLKLRGYINDSSDVKRETERCLRKHWGLLRILAHLKSKGYDEQTLDDVERALSSVDFSAQCAELIMNNYSELPKEAGERRRMISSLSRLGYSIEEIDRAMRLVRNNAV